MDLLSQTKYLIKKIGLKPDKFKGQNFCVDQKVINQMVEVAQVSDQDTVLEVGPGFGFLTVELVKKAKKVMAVELDREIVKVLKNLEKTNDNLEIIEGDILKFPISLSAPLRAGNFQFPNKDQISNFKFQTNYKIVANLPYSITSTFLRKFLTSENKPQSMTLLLQKEVAKRICAQPGAMSLLSISVQLYGQPKLVKEVKAGSFWPIPKVDSAILQVEKIKNYSYEKLVPEKIFWQVVRSGFSAKRKQLHNNLKSSLQLPTTLSQQIFKKAGLNSRIRAQELGIADWLKLANSYQEFKIDGGR